MTLKHDDTTKAGAGHDHHRELRGVFLLMGTVVCFACMDASAKWLSRDLPPLQVAGGRYLFAMLAVLLFLNPRSKPGILKTQSPGLQFLRALFLVGMTIGCFIALRSLPLTQLTAICFGAPLVTALLAGPVLGERIGPRRLVAVLVGFVGVLVVTRPFGAGLQPAVFIALGAALSNSFYFLSTRKLASRDSSETTMFYTSLLGTLLVSPLLFFVWKTPSTPLVWVVLVALGIFGAVGHWLLILAHRHAAASTLAPFFYSQILGSVFFGYSIFGELPDLWTLLGATIIIGSGLYLLYRERVRHKYPSADLSV